MYDNTRYSLTRYSANQDSRTIGVDLRFFESMGALVGAAVPVDSHLYFAETMQGSIRGTVSIVSDFFAQDNLEAAIRMSTDVVARATFTDGLQSAVYVQKDLRMTLEAIDELNAKIWVSKDIPADMNLTERLSVQVVGSKAIPNAFLLAEVLTTSFEATSQTTEQAVFQLTIPPGGDLRIDSELFQVLLDGENALHTQSGDWVNISRELLRLNIESGSGGGLDGQLIYQERYL